MEPFPLETEQNPDGSLEDLLSLRGQRISHLTLQQGDESLLQVQLDRAGLEGVDGLVIYQTFFDLFVRLEESLYCQKTLAHFKKQAVVQYLIPEDSF